MKADGSSSPRTETDTSLRVERQNTDRELARRVTTADADADEVLRLARERADRLLEAARATADARLPLAEQTKSAVELLLGQRHGEDRTVRSERQHDDTRLNRERSEQREKLVALLVLERQTTDLHLALERSSADDAVATREEFLAQVSHDLRGLMAAHRLYLALLVKGVSSDECGRQIAPQLTALAQIDAQMDRMMADLVDIAAIEAGRLTVEPRSHAATDLLSNVTRFYEPLARERGQSL
jgi:signal transduction histidine kinase